MMVVLVIMFVRYVSYGVHTKIKMSNIVCSLNIVLIFCSAILVSIIHAIYLFIKNRIVDMSLQKVLPLGRHYQITIVVLHVVHPNVDLPKYPRVEQTKEKSLLLLVKKMNHPKRNRGFRKKRCMILMNRGTFLLI